MKKLYTEKEVLEIVENTIKEIYTSPTPPTGQQPVTTGQPPAQTPQPAAPTTSGGQNNAVNYSFEVASLLKALAPSLGANKAAVVELISGIFDRLSPGWSAQAKQKFMQLSGMSSYQTPGA